MRGEEGKGERSGGGKEDRGLREEAAGCVYIIILL